MLDADTALTQIGWTRSDPPGSAGSDPRRRATYSAALQQFEELLEAAQVAGPASRALPLFYALSQAGRAIVAAYGEQAETRGHGLAEAPPEDPTIPLLRRRIRRRASQHDTFGALARVTSSGDFDGEVELGALWVANPDSPRLPLEHWQPDWRLALLVVDEDAKVPAGVEIHEKAKMLRVLPFSEPMEATAAHGSDLGPDRYPTIPDEAAGTTHLEREFGEERSWVGYVIWRTDMCSIDQIAPKVAFGESRYLIPRLANQEKMLSPLMLWWVLLYGFSVYARYHPELWQRTLDVDRSSAAVGIEHIMTHAMKCLPGMIYNALLGKFYPIPEELRLS